MKDNNTTESFGDNISIIGGKWTMRVPEGTEGATSRPISKGQNEGKLVWEKGWASLEGYVMSGGLKQVKSYGMQGEFVLKDGDEVSNIGIPVDGRYLGQFISCMPNINWSDKVRLELKKHATKKTKTGGDVFNLRVFQNGSPIYDYYREWKKDSTGKNVCTCLNGLPDKETTVRGDDYTKQENFLLDAFDSFFKTYSGSQVPVVPSTFEDKVPDSVTMSGESQVPSDDPFDD